jgi:hypothetical protein
MIYPFWISTFVCLVVVSLGSLKSYYGYMEGFARYLKRRGNKASLERRLVFDSNLSLFVLMSMIWSFFALLVVYLYQHPVMGFLSGLAVLLTFYLFAVLLMETYVVYMPINNKIHFLLGFAAGLELILPMILSWIFEFGALFYLSPFGYISYLINPLMDKELSVDISVMVFNLLLCFPLFLLVMNRYSYALRARKAMTLEASNTKK